MWVELTGSHSCEAIITVIAAERAIQNALDWVICVISCHTVLINLGPYMLNHIAIQAHPTKSIESEVDALLAIAQFNTDSLMAIKGHIAFATSFAQWAKQSSDTEQIRGILNSLFVFNLLFLNFLDTEAIIGFTTKNVIIAIRIHIQTVVYISIEITFLSHFKIR